MSEVDSEESADDEDLDHVSVDRLLSIVKQGFKREYENQDLRFQERKWWQCLEAAERLGDLKEERAISALLELLADAWYRFDWLGKEFGTRKIVDALGKIGKPAVEDLLNMQGQWDCNEHICDDIDTVLAVIGVDRAAEEE